MLVSFLYQLGVDEDTTAVFADDDLLVKLQVYLTLGGDLIEAATTSITVDRHYGQTIASTLTDAVEGM